MRMPLRVGGLMRDCATGADCHHPCGWELPVRNWPRTGRNLAAGLAVLAAVLAMAGAMFNIVVKVSMRCSAE